MSPAPPTPASSSYSSRIAAGEGSFFDRHGGGGYKGSNAGKAASSFPRGGFDLTAMKKASGGGGVPASELTTVSVVNDSLVIHGEFASDSCFCFMSLFC